MFFIIFVMHNCCLVDVLISTMAAPLPLRSSQNTGQLHHILTMHQEQLDSFLDIQRILNIYNTTQFICTVIQATLFAYILMFQPHWFAGYVLLAVSLLVVFVTCFYGTMYESKAIQLGQAIFNVLDWTNLTPAQRRKVYLLLECAQKNQQLRCGKMFVINYKTFLSVSDERWLAGWQ